MDRILSLSGGDETLSGNTLPQYSLRPGAVGNAENEVRRISSGLQGNDKRADPVRSRREVARHFDNRTGDPSLPSPEDIGYAHHGSPCHTGEPYELPPRQRSFHRELSQF